MDPDSVCIKYWRSEMSNKLKGNTRRIPQKHRITTFMNMKFLTIDELNSAWMMEQMVLVFKKEKMILASEKHINKYLTISIDIVIE